MNSKINSLVEFFNPYGSDILKGYVLEDYGPFYLIRVQHGKYHDELMEIRREDVLDEYGDLETEEKFLYFREED